MQDKKKSIIYLHKENEKIEYCTRRGDQVRSQKWQ